MLLGPHFFNHKYSENGNLFTYIHKKFERSIEPTNLFLELEGSIVNKPITLLFSQISDLVQIRSTKKNNDKEPNFNYTHHKHPLSKP
jgi:hypothetical protein